MFSPVAGQAPVQSNPIAPPGRRGVTSTSAMYSATASAESGMVSRRSIHDCRRPVSNRAKAIIPMKNSGERTTLTMPLPLPVMATSRLVAVMKEPRPRATHA